MEASVLARSLSLRKMSRFMKYLCSKSQIPEKWACMIDDENFRRYLIALTLNLIPPTGIGLKKCNAQILLNKKMAVYFSFQALRTVNTIS